MSGSEQIVVIGAGQAAGQLVESLRQDGFEGEIVLVGEEPYKPYQRPPLSKKFLAGEMTEERLMVRPDAFYEKHSVTLKLGQVVEAIDRAAKTVNLVGGEKIPYTKLAITTGARVRKIPIPGADLKGVLYSRGIADIALMKEFLDSSPDVAIIGAGFIGLETAAVLRKMGKNVTVIEMQDRVMPRVVAPLVSEFYKKAHEAHGVVVRTNVSTNAFESDADGRISAVMLGDGTKIPAQMAVVGIGVIPNVELAQAAGLTIDNGISVDEHARTSDPDIVAAGDVASHPNGFFGRRIRPESVHNAVEQAKTAAATLVGGSRIYEQYPWFWSDQYDLKLQMVGLSQGYDAAIVRGDIASNAFSVFYFQGPQLLAVDSINKPADHMQARRILNNRIALSQEQAADLGCELKVLGKA